MVESSIRIVGNGLLRAARIWNDFMFYIIFYLGDKIDKVLAVGVDGI